MNDTLQIRKLFTGSTLRIHFTLNFAPRAPHLTHSSLSSATHFIFSHPLLKDQHFYFLCFSQMWMIEANAHNLSCLVALDCCVLGADSEQTLPVLLSVPWALPPWSVAIAGKGGCGAAVGRRGFVGEGSFYKSSVPVLKELLLGIQPNRTTGMHKQRTEKSMNAWSVFGLVEKGCISFLLVYSQILRPLILLINSKDSYQVSQRCQHLLVGLIPFNPLSCRACSGTQCRTHVAAGISRVVKMHGIMD